jgi:hypothetical protein
VQVQALMIQQGLILQMELQVIHGMEQFTLLVVLMLEQVDVQ